MNCKRSLRCNTALALTMFAISCGGVAPHAKADTVAVRYYYGGPILAEFKIYPLFYGNWNQTDIDNQYTYLQKLAAYMSGQTAPVGQRPVTWQYGVSAVTVASQAKSSLPTLPTKVLNEAAVQQIIHENRKPDSSGAPAELRPCGRTTLILSFSAPTIHQTANAAGSIMPNH